MTVDRADRSRTIPRFIGPFSLLGVCLGVVAWTLPLIYGGSAYWLFAVPALGPVLLVVPGVTRQLGAGLVASILVWPFTLIGWILTLTVVGSVGSLG